MSKVIDMTGQRCGMLTVLRRAENTKIGQAQWECQCDCGKIVIALGQYLRNGKIKSCGCWRDSVGHLNFKDITGQQFTKLTVIKYVGLDNNKHSLWECKCECGKTIIVTKPNLTNNTTKSCGCLKSSAGETRIANYLTKNKIQFVQEYSFNDLKGDKNYPLRFDFYLPNYNILIEYDGIQHFQEGFFTNSLTHKYDSLKNAYCKEKGYTLIRISYKSYNEIESILKEKLDNKLNFRYNKTIPTKTKTMGKKEITIMVLKEKTQEAFDYIKNHGGECKTSDIMEGLGLEKIASVTGRVNSLVKNGLAVTEDGGKTEDGKKITIVKLTEAGYNYVPSDDEE